MWGSNCSGWKGDTGNCVPFWLFTCSPGFWLQHWHDNIWLRLNACLSVYCESRQQNCKIRHGPFRLDACWAKSKRQGWPLPIGWWLTLSHMFQCLIVDIMCRISLIYVSNMQRVAWGKVPVSTGNEIFSKPPICAQSAQITMCILAEGLYVYSGWRPLTFCRLYLKRARRARRLLVY